VRSGGQGYAELIQCGWQLSDGMQLAALRAVDLDGVRCCIECQEIRCQDTYFGG